MLESGVLDVISDGKAFKVLLLVYIVVIEFVGISMVSSTCKCLCV